MYLNGLTLLVTGMGLERLFLLTTEDSNTKHERGVVKGIVDWKEGRGVSRIPGLSDKYYY